MAKPTTLEIEGMSDATRLFPMQLDLPSPVAGQKYEILSSPPWGYEVLEVRAKIGGGETLFKVAVGGIDLDFSPVSGGTVDVNLDIIVDENTLRRFLVVPDTDESGKVAKDALLSPLTVEVLDFDSDAIDLRIVVICRVLQDQTT